jgi:hypothetical protein
MRVISSTTSRVERYFPVRVGDSASVLLLNPARNSTVPPIDLLKLSTFLRKRGYAPVLRAAPVDTSWPEPYAVVFSTVFSWDIPLLRQFIASVHGCWPEARTILTGVLPRKFGDSVQDQFGVRALDESSEVLLDDECLDYSLVPEWDASIVITSRGVCPRECSHCEAAVRGKRVTKLITKWQCQLNPGLPRVEVWDNTLMLTPREHFRSVAKRLSEIQKPVDFVCGLAPGGVEEAELFWRISHLSEIQLQPARLECNQIEDLPRFFRLLAHSRSIFDDTTRYRAFAVVNGAENPQNANERIRRMQAQGMAVDVVWFTPHDWESLQPYLNRRHGWTSEEIGRIAESKAL